VLSQDQTLKVEKFALFVAEDAHFESVRFTLCVCLVFKEPTSFKHLIACLNIRVVIRFSS
ncbi:hypothetical protein, partial [Alicyclobacillus ferrooxydans]|uniref:hypothetical protein n=1 Tax=Alicyclobacillus ferrooxydans TaxID=471514 RepID=UPI001B8097E4